ncbi:Rne/Rng family ribonuclease [Tissierella creatinophila]|uniref:Ribonuclease G n=1 Tax=Tissierella creatinophila DSM 6911 TaxID=1123403 RepID=A0A1U7M7N2_TISCR|nr:Rne/Rng family ribonuclease [Tissierella creatinophila]OLS03333.1 ribonuclease G [Tissierella creatinophila DSM 6911]
MNHIFIDSDEEKNYIAIVEDEILVEYFVEEKTQKKTLGNIYRGRVENVLRGMQAAFVNIGEGKNAYLYLTDALNHEEKFSDKKHSIEDILKIGDEVIVQVIKEPLGNKGSKISTNLTFTGRYIVLTPSQKGINISKKIKNSEEIERLKQIGKSFEKDDVGVIFRTVSNGINEETILEEYSTLLSSYKKVEGQRNFLPTPKLIYRETDLIQKIVIDNFNEKDYKITVSSKEVYEKLLELEESLNVPIKEKVTLDLDFDFKYDNTIQKGLKIALSRNVKLKSGGTIVIDSTEALTAIDVNTHKYVGALSLDDTILKTNLEAAEEIAKQLRLRNIGGIIILDFIDMKSSKDIDRLMNTLEGCFSKDKNKPYIVDITKLGLIEVTRKKERPTLESEILSKCPTCEGRGRIKK